MVLCFAVTAGSSRDVEALLLAVAGGRQHSLDGLAHTLVGFRPPEIAVSSSSRLSLIHI